jgi:hypothetical protein
MSRETLGLRTLDNLKATDNSKLTGGATVTIASKFPFPFILQLHDWREYDQPVLGGGVRRVKESMKRISAKPVTIDGASWAQNKGPHQQLANGYAITHGVPKAFWDEWLEQNKEAEFIANGMIFARDDVASAISQTNEMKDVKSGLERCNPADTHRHGFAPYTGNAAD